MLLVTLDLNALIGMQLREQRAIWEPILTNPQHLLVVTDDTFLEACRSGPLAVDDIMRPLGPFRERARIGRKFSELCALEVRENRLATKRDLVSLPRSDAFQQVLAHLANGRPGFASLWNDEAFRKDIARRHTPEATDLQLRIHAHSLRELCSEHDRAHPRAAGTKSLTQKMRMDVFLDDRIALCLDLAQQGSRRELAKDGAHWMRAADLSARGCFGFRRELVKWIRALQLLHNDKLRSWESRRDSGQMIREYFDMEYVAMSSLGDIAACNDTASRTTLEILSVAMEKRFGNRFSIATPMPALISNTEAGIHR